MASEPSLQPQDAAAPPLTGRDILTSTSTLLSSTWPFHLNDLPEQAYLVGGSVRDGLLGRQSDHLDLDFVLAHKAVSTARAIASRYDAGFVLLDAERSIARVVFPHATADFAEQMGSELEDDLRRRDFTINAIAYSPHRNSLVDPTGGTADLKKHRLRMISAQNLKEDPLRLLRAYRQAAQLDFTVDVSTQQSIRRLAPLIRQVAPERVYAELSYLLHVPGRGTHQLTQAWQDGLLQPWLPDVSADSLAEVAQIDRAAEALIAHNPAFEPHLLSWPKAQQQAAGVGRSWMKVAKLSCLTHHPQRAEQQLWQLKCSRAEVQTVLLLLKIRQMLQASPFPPPWHTLTRLQQYGLFKQTGAAFPACAVLAIALGADAHSVANMMARFADPADPVAHPTPLLSGHDLIKQLALRPSPRIGQLLERLSEAHAEGVIDDADGALDLAEAWLAAED
ncbi:MAG: CCA tRNA nucleotidyltransferase [Cyanobacteria bacterium P01_A01_bin.135]